MKTLAKDNQAGYGMNSRLSQWVHRPRSRQFGFTLIELMIVVVVVAILAIVAYPSYVTSVRKGKRGQAKADLLTITTSMERCFTQNNSYLLCWGGTNVLTAPSNQSPTNGTKVYDLALSNVAATTYTVTATPVAGTDQAIDNCGALGINQAGQKTPITTSTGSPCF